MSDNGGVATLMTEEVFQPPSILTQRVRAKPAPDSAQKPFQITEYVPRDPRTRPRRPTCEPMLANSSLRRFRQAG